MFDCAFAFECGITRVLAPLRLKRFPRRNGFPLFLLAPLRLKRFPRRNGFPLFLLALPTTQRLSVVPSCAAPPEALPVQQL
jgi:hypothetical protein